MFKITGLLRLGKTHHSNCNIKCFFTSSQECFLPVNLPCRDCTSGQTAISAGKQ
ncbi:hypothetical protein XENOCAPTIV_009486, partial [Xenoophorus captivus]